MTKKTIAAMTVRTIIDDIEASFIVNKLRIKNAVINIKENLIARITSAFIHMSTPLLFKKYIIFK